MGKLINFYPHRHLMEEARKVMAHLASGRNKNNQHAVRVLEKAFDIADTATRHKIVVAMGLTTHSAAVDPLVQIMLSPDQDHALRQTAAIQAAILGELNCWQESVYERLTGAIASGNRVAKALCAYALGWKNHDKAISLLVGLMDHEDRDVCQAAINALVAIDHPQSVALMIERLESGSIEQQRVILCNLWRLSNPEYQLFDLYRRFIEHSTDDTLRYDALLALDEVAPFDQSFSIYVRSLRSSSAAIRQLALNRIAEEADTRPLSGLEVVIEPLTGDTNSSIRRAAVQLMNRIRKGPRTM